MSGEVTLTRYADCMDAFRSNDLKQALYDEGDVIMNDVLVNLHGEAHRGRRRTENPLFRREIFRHFEHELFPPIIDSTLRPYEAEGRADLAKLGHQLLLNLSAPIAGIDRPAGTPDETRRLNDCLLKFIEGATLAHSTRDKQEVTREVEAKIEDFDREFFGPSMARRQQLLAEWRATGHKSAQPPKDILTLLLGDSDSTPLGRETLRREVAFYLLAGAHTSATAFTRTLDAIFGWLQDHPAEAERVRTNRAFVQRCVYETIRLRPSSPVAVRWALKDIVLKSGVKARKGDRVVFDLVAANRDPTVFGPTASEFNADRELPEGVARYGLSFGAGMHACIGRELAAGAFYRDGANRSEHIYGLVAVAVQALIERGARPDPEHPPVMDPSTKRPYWSSYRVRLR